MWVCTLPHTKWDSAHFHSSLRGEMVFKAILVPALVHRELLG